MIIFSQLISYLMTALVSTGFFTAKYPWRYRLLLSSILTCMSFSLGDVLGQFITPLFLLTGVFQIFFTTKDRIWNVILFQLGWFWFVISDYIVTIPMWFWGYPVSTIQTTGILCFIYVSLHSIISFLPSVFLTKYLRKNVYAELTQVPVKARILLCIDVSICCCIYVFNIIYGSFHDFEQGVLFFNGLIFTLYLCCNLVIFYLLYRVMHENKRLALETAQKENLLSYIESLESMYQNMRLFRHDYINILSTLKCYIDASDLSSLTYYFNNKILPASSSITSQDFVIGSLSFIKIPELKSIFYVKLISAIQCNLHLTMELSEDISNVCMDSLKLCNIIGILLDNAIEASTASADKELHIALVCGERALLIHIENSTAPLTVPIEQLYRQGYTSKHGNHSGLGLFEVRNIICEMPNVFLTTNYKDGFFAQELEIMEM